MADPASIGVKVALMAVSMAITASRKIEGPRLEATKVTLAEYGTPIYRFWGRRRFDGLPIIWAEDLREEKVESKTKGGKFENYKYYATFGFLICDHEIDALSRMWFDRKLVYDLTKVGPISPAAMLGPLLGSSSFKPVSGRNLRLYLGTEDQDVDPRYQLWCEDRYGDGSATAFRGESYVVIEELPLEPFGNRIPQISAEAVNVKQPAYLKEVKVSAYGDVLLCFAPDFSRFVTATFTPGGDFFEIWDTAAREVIHSGRFPVPVDGVFGVGAGAALFVLTGFFSAAMIDPDGSSAGTEVLLPYPAAGVNMAGGQAWLTAASGHTFAQLFTGAGTLAIDVGFMPSYYFTGPGGLAWVVGMAGTTMQFRELGGEARAFAIASPTGSTTIPHLVGNSEGNLFGAQGLALFVIDPDTGAIVASATSTSSHDLQSFLNHDGSDRIWLDGAEYSTLDATLVRSINFNNWGIGSAAVVYDPINHALLGSPLSDNTHLNWIYLDRVTNAGTTLGTIVADVSGWAGVTGTDISQLTQTVTGYSVVRGSANEMLEPLFDIHDVDPCPHDFGITFKVRGAAAAGLIESDEFVASDSTRFSVEIKQDRELPREVLFKYADDSADQQGNTARDSRAADAVDSDNGVSLDLSTYVSTPAEAQPLCERYLRRRWAERETLSLTLAVRRAGLEPGDVYQLSIDGSVRTARLDKVTRKGLTLETEWKRDDPRLHDPNASVGPTMDGRDEEVVFVPPPTKGVVIDLPMTSDAEVATSPVLRYAAGSYLPAWSGAQAWQVDAEGDLVEWNSITSDQAMRWGYATTALADVGPWHWDRASILNVRVKAGGALFTVTEAALLADPSLNQAAVRGADGWEIINFASAVLESDGSYTLTNLLRGRRGTEGAVGGHAIGGLFVLTSTLLSEAMSIADLGAALEFRIQSVGRSAQTAEGLTLTFSAASLKPYSPTAFKAVRDAASGDWSFSWIRRTRIGGVWTTGTAIPLGENSEAYELVIGDRVIATSTAAATWTAAQQVADLGAPQASLPAGVAVYQLSDLVGRGFASTAPLAA